MKKRIFIAIQYLNIGGAERALIGLLNAFDYDKYDVDLFIYNHTGEFMKFVPKGVNLLPEIKKYSTLTRPLKDIIKEGYFDVALGRIYAKIKAYIFNRRNHLIESMAIFQYVANYTTFLLPSLKKYGNYDLAISFLTPHNIVRDKVLAKKKIAWIHTDYSYVTVNTKMELPVWDSYDYIVSISDAVTNNFLGVFPSLKNKIILIENILSETFVREQAILPINDIMPRGTIKLCTVGRYSYPKAIDRSVFICKELVDKGIDVVWYIIGYGADENIIIDNIKDTGMNKSFILLGKKTNPYPYMKKCDIYVQPSRYEGKAVTVREAQILCKPVIITNYPTSKDQLTDGVDGIVIGQDVKQAADEIAEFIHDNSKRNEMINFLETHHYGNEFEVQKIYNLVS